MKKLFSLLSIAALLSSVVPLHSGTAQAAVVNLVPNPSLESGSSLPTSWSKVNGSSRNVATFAYPVAGYDGAKAASVTATQYRSGDLGWTTSMFDVTAGQQYDVTTYSKSNVSTTMLAVYQKGSKSVTTRLGTVSGTNAWKAFTKTVTIPTGVTKMSLRQVLRQNGSLAIDAYMVNIHQVVASTVPTNGDFETVNPNDNSLPLAWSQGGWGTNTAVYTYPTPGKTGNGAKVEITSYTDGDAKWVFDPIAVSGGQTYTFQFDYTSNVASNITLEYHMTDGSYTYGWLGDPAASAGWTTYSGQFTVPAHADTVTVYDALVSVGTLTIDNVVLTNTTSGNLLFPNGMITLEFDDTWQSQYDVARPILNAAGIKATFAAITDPNQGIGSTDYMTWTEVNTLKNDGHEIASHTRTHPDLTTLTTAQAWDEINGSKTDIMNHISGYTPTTFVYPFGQFNAAVKQQVKDAGYVGARSVFDGFNFPTSDKYALVDKHIESTTTIADVQGWIAQAQADKTWLVLELHEQVNSGADQYHNTPAMMQAIVDAITNSGIQAVTIQQGIGMMNP